MRSRLVLTVWLLLMVAVVLAGCKEDVPKSALDRFIARTESLEGQALTDTLQTLARGGAPYNAFANYLLGNNLLTLPVEMKHLKDERIIVISILILWPLVGIKNILHEQ